VLATRGCGCQSRLGLSLEAVLGLRAGGRGGGKQAHRLFWPSVCCACALPRRWTHSLTPRTPLTSSCPSPLRLSRSSPSLPRPSLSPSPLLLPTPVPVPCLSSLPFSLSLSLPLSASLSPSQSLLTPSSPTPVPAPLPALVPPLLPAPRPSCWNPSPHSKPRTAPVPPQLLCLGALPRVPLLRVRWWAPCEGHCKPHSF